MRLDAGMNLHTDSIGSLLQTIDSEMQRGEDSEDEIFASLDGRKISSVSATKRLFSVDGEVQRYNSVKHNEQMVFPGSVYGDAGVFDASKQTLQKNSLGKPLLVSNDDFLRHVSDNNSEAGSRANSGQVELQHMEVARSRPARNDSEIFKRDFQLMDSATLFKNFQVLQEKQKIQLELQQIEAELKKQQLSEASLDPVDNQVVSKKERSKITLPGMRDMSGNALEFMLNQPTIIQEDELKNSPSLLTSISATIPKSDSNNCFLKAPEFSMSPFPTFEELLNGGSSPKDEFMDDLYSKPWGTRHSIQSPSVSANSQFSYKSAATSPSLISATDLVKQNSMKSNNITTAGQIFNNIRNTTDASSVARHSTIDSSYLTASEDIDSRSPSRYSNEYSSRKNELNGLGIDANNIRKTFSNHGTIESMSIKSFDNTSVYSKEYSYLKTPYLSPFKQFQERNELASIVDDETSREESRIIEVAEQHKRVRQNLIVEKIDDSNVATGPVEKTEKKVEVTLKKITPPIVESKNEDSNVKSVNADVSTTVESFNSLESDKSSDVSVENVTMNFKTLSNINLPRIKDHHAKFYIEIKNGDFQKSTPRVIGVSDKQAISMNSELEIPIDSDMKSVVITLKCKYRKLKNEVVEVVEKVPLEKKSFFGKRQYKMQRRYIQKQTDTDVWEKIVAKDGTLGHTQIKLEDVISKASVNDEVRVKLMNGWTRQASGVKPQYQIATLSLSIS